MTEKNNIIELLQSAEEKLTPEELAAFVSWATMSKEQVKVITDEVTSLVTNCQILPNNELGEQSLDNITKNIMLNSDDDLLAEIESKFSND